MQIIYTVSLFQILILDDDNSYSIILTQVTIPI